MTAVPGAREVREEDAFDVARVADWLRAHADTPEGLDGEPDVRQFTGGASNLTYLLRFPSGRDLIVRRAPKGTKAKGAHDMHREYVIQSALAPVFDYVAPMVAFCDDPDVVGGDFYAMDRIAGVIPRSEWPAGRAAVGRAGPRAVPRRRRRARRAARHRPGVRRAQPTSARAPATSDARSRAGPRATATPAPRTCPTSRA